MSSPIIHNPQQTLVAAVALARAGEHSKARHMLRQVVRALPDDERAWMWLAFVAASVEEKRAALRKALLLRSGNERVRSAYMELLSGEHLRTAAQRGVFISYSRSDELFAIELAESLRDHGIRAWLDVAEIAEDDDWYVKIKAGLQSCGVMLVIVSPESLDDDIAQYERENFGEAGKIIIPLLYRHSDQRLPLVWHPAVDCRHDPRPGIYQLIRLLAAATVHLR
ncbi:MAG: toll/interleukin-1 receptor domain-containing protein [Chloroflexi bacterium]|nr:toll/interleukin-1 receptor domain-containing protein [Chloroflexota bacterium]